MKVFEQILSPNREDRWLSDATPFVGGPLRFAAPEAFLAPCRRSPTDLAGVVAATAYAR